MQKGPYGRKDRLIKEKRNDTYRHREKWPEPTRCSVCGAVFTKGRWTWEKTPEQAHEAVCPACRRILDHYPAGTLELKGDFFESHREEILNLVRNVEKAEMGEHPLERIMAVEEAGECTLITTTGVHIARRILEALARSYEGKSSFQYGDGSKNIRGFWER